LPRGDSKGCLECRKENNKKWYQNNKEKTILRSREWQKKNPERKKEIRNKWAKENSGKVKQIYSKSGKAWRSKNKHLRAAIQAKRKAAQKRAIPKWVNLSKIKEIYKQAAFLTQKTGVKHHVDHIYPLQNKYMCGLHVETNLQILTDKENTSKGNRTWPGQLECQKD